MTKHTKATKAARPTRAIVRKRGKGKAKVTKAEVVELPKRNGSVVPQSFKAKAGKSGVMRADDLGKAVTDAFLGATSPREACDAILSDNGLDAGRWAGKNPGMLRMNLVNVLRGIRRNGGEVIVRGKRFAPTEA